ncbi:MAG: ABC transporter permease [Oscillospiraceae bacterium]|jgi:hypothetical protein|nr:ABC transporter permease [Oscillospiraceae bacterium]
MRKIFKLSYEYILFYLQLLFIALFVLVLLAYNLDIAEKSFLERRMFSENVRGMWLGDPRVDTDVAFEFPEIPNADYMLYKNLDDSFDITRAIWGTSDVFGLSSFIDEGRFFNTDDYASNVQAVVVGSDMVFRSFEENGKRYLHYDGRLFEVIGVFCETGTVLDRTIYVNLRSILETHEHLALYYIDARDEDTVSRVVSEFQQNAEGKYKIMLQEYESSVHYGGIGGVNHTMLLTAVIAAVLNLLITVIFFVTHKKHKVAVQKLYGMTSKNLAWSYGKSIAVIITASFISVVLVIVGLSQYMGGFFTLEKLAVYHFMIMGGGLIALGMAVVFFIVKLARKVNISDTLKGR